MQYRDYGKMGYQVSAFGMGCMRLPRIIKGNEAVVDREKAYEMIRYAADHGVTYFDTAFVYHNKTSEEVLGEALAEGGRREKVKIATKLPFNLMKNPDMLRKNLELSLKKLRTSYIDVYLIHNINQGCWNGIKELKIIEEYEKCRSEGLIRGIAFSYHGKYPLFKEVLDFYNWDMCQIQQNLVDVNREATEEAIHQAGKKGCALVIMEPIRGGNLANPPPAVQAINDGYKGQGAGRSPIDWAFRHLINYSEVSTVLSGVNTLEQLKENIEIFSKPDARPGCLSDEEKKIIVQIREKYHSMASIPCTACEYCLPCPQGVGIPQIFGRYNDGIMFETFEPAKRGYYMLAQGKQDVSHCVECKACEAKCPQHIGIVSELKKAHEKLQGWIE
jgi:predicted aldo/keto reductase-like oxidoreductase